MGTRIRLQPEAHHSGSRNITAEAHHSGNRMKAHHGGNYCTEIDKETQRSGGRRRRREGSDAEVEGGMRREKFPFGTVPRA